MVDEKNFLHLFKPEFQDPLKEARLLTKLSIFITEENFNPSLYSYLEDLIKTYQIHFTEIKESETIEDKRDRLYIESTKLSFVAFITDSLLRFQFESNTQSNNSKIDDEEIMKAANIMVTLLDLKSDLKISTVNALARIIQERNYSYYLKDNKDFLIKILNYGKEKEKKLNDLQRELGMNVTKSLDNDITNLSKDDQEELMSKCTLKETHLGLLLVCPPEIFQNYIADSAKGIQLFIDFNGHENKVICVSESDDQSSTIEHENFHIIYSHILDEKRLRTAIDRLSETLKDIHSFLIKNEGSSDIHTPTESFKLNEMKKFNSFFLNELFAQTVFFYKFGDEIKEAKQKYVNDARHLEILKLYEQNVSDYFLNVFRTGYFPMYLYAFDLIVHTNQDFYSDEKNLQELMDLKSKIVKEWESVIGKTFDLIMKYDNLKELISFTISISDSDNINKNLSRLEVFLEKYSKKTS